MARRVVPIAVVLGLLLASCSAETAPTTTEAPDPLNRLVTIDAVGNIVTINPDGSDAVPVTADGRGDTFYFQPQWSPSSDRLAWSQGTSGGFSVGMGDASGGNVETVPMPSNPFYLYWSPDERWIGALHNAEAGGLDLEVVDTENRTTSVAATGAPFYFSWDSSGSQMVAHIGETRLELIGAEGGVTDLGVTGPAYQAPQWTSAGVIHLRGNDVILFEPDGEEEILATVSGPTTFLANDAGTRLAVQTAGGSGGITAGVEAMPAIPRGSVVILDVSSGEVDRAIDNVALGYFWSPDGESLLIVEPTADIGVVDLTVWHAGAAQHLVTYRPDGTFFRDLLPFFTQYAQSIRLWSPDSSTVAYAGSVEGRGGIWVQSLSDNEPRFVAEGSWVVWSTR